MNVEDVPDELKKMLDEAAGKEHSADGEVMHALAAILTVHEHNLMRALHGLKSYTEFAYEIDMKDGAGFRLSPSPRTPFTSTDEHEIDNVMRGVRYPKRKVRRRIYLEDWHA